MLIKREIDMNNEETLIVIKTAILFAIITDLK